MGLCSAARWVAATTAVANTAAETRGRAICRSTEVSSHSVSLLVSRANKSVVLVCIPPIIEPRNCMQGLNKSGRASPDPRPDRPARGSQRQSTALGPTGFFEARLVCLIILAFSYVDYGGYILPRSRSLSNPDLIGPQAARSGPSCPAPGPSQR